MQTDPQLSPGKLCVKVMMPCDVNWPTVVTRKASSRGHDTLVTSPPPHYVNCVDSTKCCKTTKSRRIRQYGMLLQLNLSANALDFTILSTFQAPWGDGDNLFDFKWIQFNQFCNGRINNNWWELIMTNSWLNWTKYVRVVGKCNFKISQYMQNIFR